ncbi:MAG: TRAP transporter small permease subunit [Alphaproteobacteria bacterium]|nr:TRAP transporter small permease subunit [Alphaproteobacteria bacterium]
MGKTLQKAVDRIELLVELVGRTVAWLVLGLVMLVAINVLARYMFSAGTVALQELEWHVLAVTALVGMSYGINRGDEVRVDMLYGSYGPRTKAAVDLLSGVLMLLVAAFIVKVSLGYVAQSYAYQEGSPDPGGLPYRYMLKALIPFGFVLLALQAIVEIAKALRALKIASSPAGDQPSES